MRGGSGDEDAGDAGADGVRGGNGEPEDGAPGGGDHGAPVGMADGPPPRPGVAAGADGAAGPDVGAPDTGGLDTGRAGAAVPFSAGRPGPDGRPDAGAAPAASDEAPFEPLVSSRIGDGRRVRNQPDSTSRKIGGSSIVASGRGAATSSSLLDRLAWPLPAGAGGAQSSRTRGISAVMSSAGE